MSLWRRLVDFIAPTTTPAPKPVTRGEAARRAVSAVHLAEDAQSALPGDDPRTARERRTDDWIAEQLLSRAQHPAGSARPVQRPGPGRTTPRPGSGAGRARATRGTNPYDTPGYGIGHPLYAGGAGYPSSSYDSGPSCSPSSSYDGGSSSSSSSFGGDSGGSSGGCD